jgi:hypothetical protein
MTALDILKVYALATPEELVAGATWYRDAQNLADSLAHTADHRPAATRNMVAGVIAALSPLTPWDRNKELAIRAIVDHEATGTLGNSVRAANRILAGEPVLDVLKSDKVRNFYLSILGDSDAVCIDRHAWEVFEGKRYTNKGRPSVTPKRYREAADAYREAAQGTGYSATALQAITWLVWRRIHLTGTRYERFL